MRGGDPLAGAGRTVDDVCDRLQAEEGGLEEVQRPCNACSFHLLHSRPILLHDVPVLLHPIQGVAAGHHTCLHMPT